MTSSGMREWKHELYVWVNGNVILPVQKVSYNIHVHGCMYTGVVDSIK